MKKRMSKPFAFNACQVATANTQPLVVLTPRETRPELFGACQLNRREGRDVVA